MALVEFTKCARCGYDQEKDREQKRAQLYYALEGSHVWARRDMLEVEDESGAVFWVCADCEYPGETVHDVKRR